MREDALADETDDAANQNAGADEERRSAGARMRWFRFGRRRGNRCADLLDSFTGDLAGRFIGGDFAVAGQRAYSLILLSTSRWRAVEISFSAERASMASLTL